LPHALHDFRCNSNEIIKIENLPKSLKIFCCNDNEITKIENLPESLEYFYCKFNEIIKIENLPRSLIVFICSENNLTKIENLPESLQVFHYEDNTIQFVDNVVIERYEVLFDTFDVKDYTKIKKCQRIMVKWFHRRKRKALIISNAVHDWIWKPLCRDGSYGVRLRLDIKELGLNPE
jgi:hypothetical protein